MDIFKHSGSASLGKNHPFDMKIEFVVLSPQMNIYFRKIYLCGALACCIALFMTINAHGATIDPDNAHIQYHGRWNMDVPKKPWIVWQGSSIIVKFEGTNITGTFDVSTRKKQYRVIVDGAPNAERLYMEPGLKTYTLADNLPSGEHTVELFQETFTTNKTTFHGLEIEGNLLSPPPRPKLRIEWFGDSNMDGTSLYSEKNTGDSGTYYAYPAMVTRMLGAEMHLEALGGATLADRGDNNVRDFIFSENFKDQDPAYRSGFKPHLIVVNAGANDINVADEKTIRQRYKDVVSDLRAVYGPDPHIVLMNAYGWDVKEPANYSRDVVNEIGDPHLTAFHYPWLWEKWHGSQWEHSGEAHLLMDHLKGVNPSWIRKNPADIIDGFGRNGDFANGSFEHTAPFGAYGWRYYDDGAERVHDPSNAPDGQYYIRLEEGEFVHQPTDATADFLPGGTEGGETYTITATMRGTTSDAQAQIITEFQGQQIWNRVNPQTATFNLSTTWKDYTAKATSAAGIWTLFNTVKATAGAVEIDNVRMTFAQK
jgi:hypothetical protein